MSYRALARVRARGDAAPVRARSGFAAAEAVETLGLARPYARYFGVEEHRLRHRRFDGRMSAPLDRAVFASGDAVTVLPFDPGRRRVLLIEQFRAGPFARRDPHPWCLEAIAGRCDAGEGPEATARREAREEAALALGRIERIAGYYTSPGTMTEHITAFVAEAELDRAGGVFGLPEEDEDIRVLVMGLDAAMALVRLGEVNNAPLLLSLLWLAAEADRLAAAWAAPARGAAG
jgi:nudix-type nucleoside diphosphatase (YffH/AdpP family)